MRRFLTLLLASSLGSACSSLRVSAHVAIEPGSDSSAPRWAEVHHCHHLWWAWGGTTRAITLAPPGLPGQAGPLSSAALVTRDTLAASAATAGRHARVLERLRAQIMELESARAPGADATELLRRLARELRDIGARPDE